MWWPGGYALKEFAWPKIGTLSPIERPSFGGQTNLYMEPNAAETNRVYDRFMTPLVVIRR